MQIIKKEISMVNELFLDFIKTYEYFSAFNDDNIVVSDRLEKLIECMNQGRIRHYKYKDSINFNFSNKQYDQVIFNQDEKSIIVCFSGGKDSVAVALKLKQMGYKIALYHLHGINKSYPDEVDRAKKMANILQLPLYIENITLSGLNEYLEHPMKNQLLCTFAFNFAIKNRLGYKIAFGDFLDDDIEEGLFDRNWSDTSTMWKLYSNCVKTTFPQFEVVIVFKNFVETLTLVSKNKELLENVQGCILPKRFKNKIKSINETKYNISLLPNRCGSCWKCCVEYMILCDLDVVDYNQKFYEHCLLFLKTKMKDEKPFLEPTKDLKKIYEAFTLMSSDGSVYFKHIK